MKKLLFLLGSIMLVVTSCSTSFSWDGTWSSSNDTIVVTLDSSTMEAEIELLDGGIKYTTEWSVIDENSIVWQDYASSQYTIMKKDGHLYSFNSFTQQKRDKQVYLHKRK